MDHNKPFTDCIKEIESNYVSFPKAHRIRIERWIEKLVTSSDLNPKWRRHRDLYARFLLSMVISKRLDEPFTQFPPDGQLQSFPVEKIYKCKDLLGPRESIFWRQMYNSLTATTQSIKQSELDLSRRNSTITAPMPGQDMYNLNLIIKEQANRIDLLEEKLQEERLRHEMQIRQLIKKYEKQLHPSNNNLVQKSHSSQTDLSHSMNSIRPLSPKVSTQPNTSILRPSSSSAATESTRQSRQQFFSPSSSSTTNNQMNRSIGMNQANIPSTHTRSHSSTQTMPECDSNSDSKSQRANLVRIGHRRPKLSDVNSGYSCASTADSEVSEVTDDAISSKLKGHKKEVWMDYMQYLDKFQHEIKSMRS